ncbi:MAG: NAD(P)H-dependent glycerol-3-phosphate dehydrogenase [Hydrocarboniphaga sp.]|uniref:NAD(P)H-dependent glycerol-3-phosphate dehydrogenase n=1 Tax=Hydrocarboniphaga sp. TaxID=2033016 RepID=UPI00260D8FA5|nr:NAD(P)H-dependent glycerol-3-phosphate dehydrogenase [Hydrocarboniphaga sp.]MDB5971645.1 NAD(P)H-dependent glycerol-3-phosphate dehydrogenase [Hydrocarboniphaga sp.]
MSRPVRVCVLGAGSWGTTVASLAAANTQALIWARREDVADEINREHRCHRYLGDLPLHPALRATSSLAEAVANCDVLVMGVPSHCFRQTLRDAVPDIRPWVPVISLAKGLEQNTHRRMTQIIHEEMPGHPAGLLAGPNIAKEVLQGLAAAAVIAMPDEQIARSLQPLFGARVFRAYTNTDVIGCELGGPLKNVIAISAGMADGLGVGHNTRSLVITRGLAEMMRLGTALGGRPETFAGLTGLGDLLTTCTSPLSRNRQVGERLARGESTADIVASMRMVAEGIKTSAVVMELAAQYRVSMPIAEEVDAVIRGRHTAIEAFAGLRRISPGSEGEAA